MENEIDLPSHKLVQQFMFKAGFDIADPEDEPVFPQSRFMKLASYLLRYAADR